ncbi:E3 ubiquitin-protein ligase NEURL1 [Latimeria chalumnae]|uniref:E3 ubiquitin-protein ligase NEURL1 n=1 Tax=Latimeria chalumnae TaxID=7897 RepID=UPI0003C184C7|nr:PREDICTED: E3 ubiquitin-protein ligase NEURL1 isoform X2 [Latimeria chalumnae]|eukprot:XP_005995883.1 PREDICTED: E3 ubiquitin-protein ligase NEURL1 isoform X2 [Latimeria chalumnae]
MGGQITRSTLYDSIGGPFPTASHQCHHKQKRCLPIPQCGGLPISPLLFHPHTKGSQIIMDMTQKVVKRQASFCNAITFSNRPVVLYEQVRLKITKKQCCWSGALRLGFTSKDPSRINPDTLPKYACPDLVSQSGFWAKALPEEFANEGNIIAFWVDKKGRVFYRVNDSSPMLFFSGVRTSEPLWALIDVYGLTRGVQLLESEIIPPDCLRPRSFTAIRRPSLRRETEDNRLSVSLCDLNLQEENFQVTSAMCPIPQNSLNSQHSHLLPSHLESDLHFHQLKGAHIKSIDSQTVSRSEYAREERTLVFTSRALRIGETIFIKIHKTNTPRTGTLSYGVTSCDPSTLRPSDLPYNPESLVDRKEFWVVCRVPVPLQNGDILGFLINSEGELLLSHNGTSAGMQVCVDSSQPLWMFFGLHGAITQIRILGSSLAEPRGPSVPSSPTSGPSSPTTCSGSSDPAMNAGGIGLLCSSSSGTAPNSPVSMPESPTCNSISGSWSEECTICYENVVDTVIYACGHMCLCYPCGRKLKQMSNACCPICRRAIKDIIKTYRST